MMGKKAIEAARVFVEETGIQDSLSAEDFLVEREDMLRSKFPTSELMPGASRLIRHLNANGIPMAVATGSHRRHFELKTQKHGEIFQFMHHIVLGDDPEVKQGKPSPDIFLAASRRFEVRSSNTIDIKGGKLINMIKNKEIKYERTLCKGGQLEPCRILVFEDAPSGVLAAKNAGMFVVMVPDPRLDSSYHAMADQVLDSLTNFMPEEWGLPPFADKDVK
ncbi:hypothetical protein Leryth_025236 [Lithospermum erythrorhizon]|nr:hypothetical protein Leryth_025236 [Lithospermum erythrorhizon]